MNLKIIDTHVHYDDDAFDEDRHELINSILNDNVKGFITIGTSIEKSLKSIEIAEKYSQAYASIGVHPEDCNDLQKDYIDKLRQMSKNNKVVAIGEIGLDYHYDGYNKKTQMKCFTEQLELASELNLPVIIHSRDATQDTIDILNAYKPKGVMHCFSGSLETAQKILELGMMISFTGVITFKNAKKAIEVCSAIPIDRLMLETDSPYMTPVPHRGKRNNSNYIIHIAEKIAEIKNIPVNEVIEICNKNAISFFGLNIE